MLGTQMEIIPALASHLTVASKMALPGWTVSWMMYWSEIPLRCTEDIRSTFSRRHRSAPLMPAVNLLMASTNWVDILLALCSVVGTFEKVSQAHQWSAIPAWEQFLDQSISSKTLWHVGQPSGRGSFAGGVFNSRMCRRVAWISYGDVRRFLFTCRLCSSFGYFSRIQRGTRM